MEAPYVETDGAGGELSDLPVFNLFIGIYLMPGHRRNIITKVTVANSSVVGGSANQDGTFTSSCQSDDVGFLPSTVNLSGCF